MLDLSCRDWVERQRAGLSLVPDLVLPNSVEGDRAVGIFNKLRLFDVPGTPTMAEAAGDWFRRIVWALFASLDPVTKARLIRELFLLVPKKNNKTTGGALLMLTALLMNERPRAPFLLTGPVHKTADDAFAAAEGAITLDNVLHKKLHVRDHLKTIIHRETGAKLEIMTFDPDIVTGKKVVGALIDEEHILGKMPRAKKAMVQLRGGMMPFPEAFLAIITTQSDEAPAGVFKEDLTKAREIRDGKRSGQMLPVLYEFPGDMQRSEEKLWRDPANWPMVTPNLGRSIALDTLVQAFNDEEANGEAALRTWASQHLNVEIGLALMTDRWAGADFWEAAGEPGLTLEALLERSEVCVVGIDGGGLDDLLGLCVMGRERGTRRWLTWHHAWAHKIVLERRKEIAPRLLDFEAAGELSLVEKPGMDVKEVADVVCQVRDAGLLPEKHGIGVDGAGIGDIVDELTAPERGFAVGADGQIVAISQGWRLNGAIKTTERKLAGGDMVHGSLLLMNFCVGNAKIEDKGNAVSITKQVSGKAKIDPLMATFDAAYLMALNPAAMVIGEDYELTTT
ncbi:terminase large subunit [Variovorax ginsengisoli]|uniref:Terminase large subunit n=1 Tax=Variovorax ginsengisoli TaxID=363844 RepID=A0ABT8SDP8_9BURK|nr:terminase large subunit [Variovorax ginsengisoli]MDN8617861.1 terminase large subunit [Variovorax ginsengisoli]MDO1537031.1 terminase large subunit [Variovorax ginsengisoli]